MSKELPVHFTQGRYTITAVSYVTLRVAIHDEARDIPWSCVRGVSAGCAPIADIVHLALAFDIEIDAAERILFITEADRIWAGMTQILPDIFPDFPCVTSWGPLVLRSRTPLSLYDGPDGAPDAHADGPRRLH